MAHVPSICGVCRGRKPKHFCTTEGKYICNECINFCHKNAHNWKELENGQKGEKPKEHSS